MKRFSPVLVVLAACASEPVPNLSDGVEVVQRLSFIDIIDTPNVVGITVDIDTEELIFVDAINGLFNLQGDIIADRIALEPGWGVSAFTDVASLGEGKFAVTVQGDGLLHDTRTGETIEYFCYEPGFMPEDSFQLTNGLAYDQKRKKIVAQPQTYIGEEVTNSDVAEFSVQGGQPAGWHILTDENFFASAIAVDGASLLLGVQNILYRYHYGDEKNSRKIKKYNKKIILTIHGTPFEKC